MGDGGVAQQALQVALQQRQEVAGEHADHGQDGQDQGRDSGGQHGLEAPQQQREHGALGHRGDQGGHGHRRALEDIRGPEVEGDQGQLEA
jgi:hypothetical protein